MVRNVFAIYPKLNIQDFFTLAYSLCHTAVIVISEIGIRFSITGLGSYKIYALPIFIFLVYHFHGNIDYLACRNTFNQTSIFVQNWCNFHIDQSIREGVQNAN